MKFGIDLKIITAVFVFALLALGTACEQQEDECGKATTAGAQTPTEAYKSLYAAVKAKNTEAIKALMTEKSLGLADAQAKRSNQPLEKVFENGFTATTFSPTLPEIRDERVKCKMGAVEVYNSKDSRWEDLPYMLEKGSWKFAFGDIFAGTHQSPGKGRAQLEMEAANASGNNMIQMPINANVNFNAVGNTNGAPNAKTKTNAPPK